MEKAGPRRMRRQQARACIRLTSVHFPGLGAKVYTSLPAFAELLKGTPLGGGEVGGVRVGGVRKEGKIKCAYNFLKPQIVVADTKNH